MGFNNTWYTYENDVYGVQGLLEYETKEELIEYITSEDFIELRENNKFPDEGKSQIKEISKLFKENKINHIQYSEKLSKILTENKSEINYIMVEDFNSLCTGQTEFGELAVELMCDTLEIDNLKEITDDIKLKIDDFYEIAFNAWIN